MSEKVTGHQRIVLFDSEYFEVVEIYWTDKELSQLHGHGWSECSVLVCEGIFQNTLNLGSKEEIQIFEKGQVIHTPKGAKHSLSCKTPTGRTIHVYTPKINEQTELMKNFKSDLDHNFLQSLKLNEPLRFDHLKALLSEVQKKSISTSSPYFMNQLFSGISPQMLLAEDIIAKYKTTLATQEASPVFSTIESEVIQSLCALIKWNSEYCEGIVVSGGSAANFMAIHCARQKYFPDVKNNGITNKTFRIYVSKDAHYSFKKAAAVLGLGQSNVIAIDVDVAGRMKADALNDAIIADKDLGYAPLLISATAGTTVYGAFDQLDKLSKISKKHDMWLHVDGAWGGPALFSSTTKHLVSGIEKADSVTFDAHKLFGAAMTSSFFLTNQKGILLAANDVSGADYLFHNQDNAIDRGKLSWQCGRGANAFSFWTIWKSVGTKGLGHLVEKLISKRIEAELWINNQPRLSVLGQPEYLNLCVRITPPSHRAQEEQDWARIVREQLKSEQKAFVNFSIDENGTFLRFIFSHPELEAKHIIQTLEWALEIK